MPSLVLRRRLRHPLELVAVRLQPGAGWDQLADDDVFLELGSLSFWRMTAGSEQSDEHRADAIMELVKRGWKDRLLLSTDVGKRGALKSYGGGGYTFVIDTFLPLLRARGAARHNPRELFTFN